MRLRWTLAAAADLESIHEYLVHAKPALARPTIRFLYNDLSQLKRFPYLGRVAIRPEVREYFLTPLPYVCTYRVDDSAVTLLRIHHTAQDRSNADLQ